jgi:hypothetical protein
MIAVVTVVLCLPLGWFVRSRLVANTTYAVAYLWAFVFQTLYLQLDAATFPPGEFPLSYGLATASVFAVGFGLIAAAHEARSRHDVKAGAMAGTG